MTDLLLEGWAGLNTHRARTLLSTLGILFGVAAVIGILSIGEGARREQALLIEQLGILNFQVQAVEPPEDPEERAEMLRASRGLSLRDAAALRVGLPLATHVGAMRSLVVRDLVPRPDLPVSVMGADPAWLAGSQLRLVEGRPLDAADEQRRGQVCLLGEGAARAIFGVEPALGKLLRLGQVWVRVVGVFQTAGAGGAISAGEEGVTDVADRSMSVIVPLQTALGRFDLPDDTAELSEIQVALPEPSLVLGQVAVARAMLDRLHRGQEDTALVVPLRLLEQSQAQQRIFNLVMGLIAGISLLVGGIGIMNIMLASVLERTREIGVRMALGATPADIRRLFLVESGLISLLGGFLGILTGVLISRGVAAATGWSTAVGLDAVLLAAVLSMAEGVIFGFIPARRAAMLPPAIAVRQVG